MLTSFLSSTPTVLEILLLGFLSLLGGSLFALLYAIVKKKDGYYKDMVITYALFPFLLSIAIIGVSLLCLNFDESELTARIGRVAVALLAAVLIFRFRSEQRNFEDLTYLLFLSVFSLLLGCGYLYLGLVFYAVTLLFVFFFYFFHFPKKDADYCILNITIPEDLDYPGAFDPILEKYCSSYRLEKVKSADLGGVFILQYQLAFRKGVSQKEFLDQIRIRNSNLNISLGLSEFKSYK